MTRRVLPVMVALALIGVGALSTMARAAGDAEAGARVFGAACAACHTLAPGRHMTGPSLAGVWSREAGTAEGFPRFSPALRSSGVVWTETTLEPWLADPAAFLPGNWMTFGGLKDPGARTNLIAFLKTAGVGAAGPETGKTGGMMGGPRMRDLKVLAPRQRVTAIRQCGDTYRVTTAEGPLPPFWEPNLRFKTDSSGTGPAPGKPAILPAGMLGDRASVIFADPSEISAFIEKRC